MNRETILNRIIERFPKLKESDIFVGKRLTNVGKELKDYVLGQELNQYDKTTVMLYCFETDVEIIEKVFDYLNQSNSCDYFCAESGLRQFSLYDYREHQSVHYFGIDEETKNVLNSTESWYKITLPDQFAKKKDDLVLITVKGDIVEMLNIMTGRQIGQMIEQKIMANN
jgi:hypothetical protein